ncbi:radical SAM protein [Desulfohalovibrio reitneri]|uniref:radical SAM protein n=1 Tax=Desulfohalovibrio reitneri TaxID=1307759 RepID=UPI0004A75405|nr:radical SAM protein [Desulfohalovibrio reitneri]
MSKRKPPMPHLLSATADGEIVEHPELLMVVRRGDEITLPRPDELIRLPDESELFLLENRLAVGFDPESGQVEALEEPAVAAFISPGHTLGAVAAYHTRDEAARLPLFAYGAVGWAEGSFWVAARKVDEDRRQVFTNIPPEKVRQGAEKLMKRFPENRLVRHLTGCALVSGCPAAKNLALGRFEAPLPTSRACNADCLGCISSQPPDSGFPATQDRLRFTPTPDEVLEVMTAHAERAKRPILSFGQGCEGEPLTEADLLAEATRRYRDQGGPGTVNVNTNGSRPEVVAQLAKAGFSSMRVSLSSAREDAYTRYARPRSFSFDDVRECARQAKRHGLFVSLNYFFFPGVSDTENEMEALSGFIEATGVDFIQLRNLNLDPELYMALLEGIDHGPCMGLANFRKRIKKAHPGVGFGYFNPYVEQDAD